MTHANHHHAAWSDFNNADAQQGEFNLIPKGTQALVRMAIKPGGHDDASKGWTGEVIELIGQSISWVDRDLDAAIIQIGSLAMDFRKAESLAGLRGRNSARKVFNIVLSAGQGNDLSRTIEVSKTDQSKIDATVTQILPILEKIDPRLIFATLADIGIKVALKDEVKT